MRAAWVGFCLLAALVLLPAFVAGSEPPSSAAEREVERANLEQVDGQLHRGEWAAAETAARQLVDDALHRKSAGTFYAMARLALAEAGQGKTEDALWHWAVAQNLAVPFDPKPFGAPGELLASHPLRRLDEAPAGLSVRRPGDGGSPYSPPRAVETRKADLPAVWGGTPKGMRLQVVVDPQGRVALPVVAQSTAEVVSYVVLEALREWRFEPARAGETPVAALFDISFPARRPLADLANLKGSPLAEPEATLRAGRYQEAGKQVGKLWADSGSSRSLPSRGFLGFALAFKALAQAGLGETDGAICRWQAAQTLEPGLYAADLSAYGAAGKLLADHPWGESFGPPKPPPQEDSLAQGKSPEEVQRPEILTRRQPKYPENVRADQGQGTVVMESIITTTGTLRNLLLFAHGVPPGLEANALDALCDWRFKPATYRGEPVRVYYTLTVNFAIRR